MRKLLKKGSFLLNYSILSSRKGDNMKKIVPFNNVLELASDACEITAISLEHDINIADDTISGSFYINGEYKMTDGAINRKQFNFELPFDIALGSNYDRSSMVVDIDDFRYELVERNKLKVNIDLYIDGEVKEIVNDMEVKDIREIVDDKEVKDIDNNDNDEEVLEDIMPIERKIDLISEMLDNEEDKDGNQMNIDNININNNNNENVNDNDNANNNDDNHSDMIFNGFNEEEKYVTYRVYRVATDDTIGKILEKYNVTKEDLLPYNNIEDIKPGDKLIIPTNEK